MKPTIIICNDFGSINGGAAKVAINSAVGLSKRGYDVIYFCAVGPVDESLSQNVTRVICLEQRDILNNPSKINAMIQGIWNYKAEKEMNRLLNEIEGDVIVHIHGWTKCLTASIIKACEHHNIRTYISIHDYFAVCPNGGFYNYKKEKICTYGGVSIKCFLCNCDSRNYFYKIWRFVRQLVQDRYIRNSNNIIYIGTSKFSYNIISNYLKSKKVRWVSNPISIYTGPYVESYKNDIFLFVGRLSKEKGVDLFCEAMEKTGSKGLVIGEGNEIKEYKKRFRNINFVGWKNSMEMVKYIKQARALIVSSRYYEGSPLIVPEIQCFGVPCIVPDNCAASDTIQDGINGLIFKSGDIESLCCSIETIKTYDEKNILFRPDKWNNKYISMDMHLDQLISAYEA